jgi:hypothetical protein
MRGELERLKRAIAEKDRALEAVTLELAALTNGEKCDHDANICYCGVWRALDMSKTALSPSSGSSYVSAEKHDEVLRLAEGMRDAVMWLLPMAKGYAHEHAAVQSNWHMVASAEQNLTAYESAKLQAFEAGKEGV